MRFAESTPCKHLFYVLLATRSLLTSSEHQASAKTFSGCIRCQFVVHEPYSFIKKRKFKEHVTLIFRGEKVSKIRTNKTIFEHFNTQFCDKHMTPSIGVWKGFWHIHSVHKKRKRIVVIVFRKTTLSSTGWSSSWNQNTHVSLWIAVSTFPTSGVCTSNLFSSGAWPRWWMKTHFLGFVRKGAFSCKVCQKNANRKCFWNDYVQRNWIYPFVKISF